MNKILQVAKRHILSISLVAIVCMIFALAALYYIRLTTFDANYENLRNGDSKQLVVDKLGHPSEIHPCRRAVEVETRFNACHEEYWYFSFMERSIVYLDNNGRVTGKSYAVSP